MVQMHVGMSLQVQVAGYMLATSCIVLAALCVMMATLCVKMAAPYFMCF